MKGPASRPGQERGRGSSDSPAVTKLSLLWAPLKAVMEKQQHLIGTLSLNLRALGRLLGRREV